MGRLSACSLSMLRDWLEHPRKSMTSEFMGTDWCVSQASMASTSYSVTRSRSWPPYTISGNVRLMGCGNSSVSPLLDWWRQKSGLWRSFCCSHCHRWDTGSRVFLRCPQHSLKAFYYQYKAGPDSTCSFLAPALGLPISSKTTNSF